MRSWKSYNNRKHEFTIWTVKAKELPLDFSQCSPPHLAAGITSLSLLMRVRRALSYIPSVAHKYFCEYVRMGSEFLEVLGHFSSLTGRVSVISKPAIQRVP